MKNKIIEVQNISVSILKEDWMIIFALQILRKQNQENCVVQMLLKTGCEIEIR